MKPIVFTGSAVALVTPMKQDFSVNSEELEYLIRFHLENQTDALVVAGTTGESATLTDEEHMRVIAFCVEKVQGKIPVIAEMCIRDSANIIKSCFSKDSRCKKRNGLWASCRGLRS